MHHHDAVVVAVAAAVVVFAVAAADAVAALGRQITIGIYSGHSLDGLLCGESKKSLNYYIK